MPIITTHNKRFVRLFQRPRVFHIIPILTLLVFSSWSAFTHADAAFMPVSKISDVGLINFADNSNENIYIPFALQGGADWPDRNGFSPTPSATHQPASSTSTTVAWNTLPPGSTLAVSSTPVETATSTSTPTPTSSATPTPTNTQTSTPTQTPTPTFTPTLTATPTRTQHPHACEQAVRIMPLGDSITRGTSSTGTNGYRRPLFLSLQNKGHWIDFVGSLQNGVLDFDRDHEGHGGWTADGTSNSIAKYVYSFLTSNPADIVLLHIGTNDVKDGHEDPEEVALILDEIRRRSTNIQVVLALIINRGVYSPETTLYNQQVRDMALDRIAKGHNLYLVDMESALNYPDDMAVDYIHPNDSGYAKMAGVWFEALDGILPVCPPR